MVVYKTTNLINGKIYIGKDSKNIDEYIGSGMALQNAIKKYGRENFKKEILCTVETVEELNLQEKKFIKLYKEKYGKMCYNIASGGDGGNTAMYMSEEAKKNKNEKHRLASTGRIVSEETREKLRKINLGNKNCQGRKMSEYNKQKLKEGNARKVYTAELRKKMSEAKIGFKHTEETKKKISMNSSKNQLGKPMPEYVKRKLIEANCKKVVGTNVVTGEEHYFDSLKDASIWIKGNTKGKACISRCCLGGRPTAYGFIWRNLEEKRR